jgi:hypothetical protein
MGVRLARYGRIRGTLTADFDGTREGSTIVDPVSTVGEEVIGLIRSRGF